MFGITAFSETTFSEDPESILPPDIIYFNKAFLTFPLAVNKEADFALNLNKIASISALSINNEADFGLNVNRLNEEDLRVNKILDFTVER